MHARTINDRFHIIFLIIIIIMLLYKINRIFLLCLVSKLLYYAVEIQFEITWLRKKAY